MHFLCQQIIRLINNELQSNELTWHREMLHFGAWDFSAAPTWPPDSRAAFVKLTSPLFPRIDTMLKQKISEEFAAKVSEVLAMSPARDMEKNLKAGLSAWLARLDLVTREEFDVQAQVLARTRDQLREMEVRLARLEGGEEGNTPE
jgi:BMFP domain-containing protein YqiC